MSENNEIKLQITDSDEWHERIVDKPQIGHAHSQLGNALNPS